jgi:hypothetical protein
LLCQRGGVILPRQSSIFAEKEAKPPKMTFFIFGSSSVTHLH